MADALDSKSGIRKGVWVRVPPSALLLDLTDLRGYLITPGGAAEVDAGSMRVKGLRGIDISGEHNRVVP